MPVIIMLISAEFDRINVDVVSFMPLIERMMIMISESTINDAKAIAVVIKNAFKILCSFDLYAKTMLKYMIERNIKNSTITRIINNVSNNPTEKFPATRVESIIFMFVKNVGEAKIIKIETIKLANPQSNSIIPVKYLELIS